MHCKIRKRDTVNTEKCHGQQRVSHSPTTSRERGYLTEKSPSTRPKHTLSRQCQAQCCISRAGRNVRPRMGDLSASTVFSRPYTDGLLFFQFPGEPYVVTFDNKDLKNNLGSTTSSIPGRPIFGKKGVDELVKRWEVVVNSRGEDNSLIYCYNYFILFQ